MIWIIIIGAVLVFIIGFMAFARHHAKNIYKEQVRQELASDRDRIMKASVQIFHCQGMIKARREQLSCATPSDRVELNRNMIEDEIKIKALQELIREWES